MSAQQDLEKAIAETLLYQGYFKKAESLANEVLEIGRGGGDAQLETFALLLQLGFSQRLSGYPEEAVALLHQCIEIARSVPDYLSRLQAWTMIGHAYLDMGKLEAGLEMANVIEQPFEEAMTYLEMGKRQDKSEYLAKVETILVSLGTRPDFLEEI